MTARHCDGCTHCYMVQILGMTCEKGHKPRFYMPKHPNCNEWGWKRKCSDYKPKENDKIAKIPDEWKELYKEA